MTKDETLHIVDNTVMVTDPNESAKKKKKNKKKKKKNTNSDENSQNIENESENLIEINPNMTQMDIMIAKLQHAGYKRRMIEEVIDELWNQNLPHDDMETIKVILESKITATSKKPTSEDTSSVPSSSTSKESRVMKDKYQEQSVTQDKYNVHDQIPQTISSAVKNSNSLPTLSPSQPVESHTKKDSNEVKQLIQHEELAKGGGGNREEEGWMSPSGKKAKNKKSKANSQSHPPKSNGSNNSIPSKNRKEKVQIEKVSKQPSSPKAKASSSSNKMENLKGETNDEKNKKDKNKIDYNYYITQASSGVANTDEMAGRLQIAAMHDNTTEAIMTLSQWIQQYPEAVETSLIKLSKTLELLLSNILNSANSVLKINNTDKEDTIMMEPLLKQKLTDFLEHLLSNSEQYPPYKTIQEMVSVIELALKFKDAIEMTGSQSLVLVVDLLSSQIRDCYMRCKASSALGDDVPQYHVIPQLSQRVFKKELDLRELVNMREAQVELSSQFNAACEGLFADNVYQNGVSGSNNTYNDTVHRTKALTDTMFTEALGGQFSTGTDMLAKKKELIALRDRAQFLIKDKNEKLEPLRNEEQQIDLKLGECKTKREMLLKELHAVDSQIAGFENKKRNILSTIEDINENCRKVIHQYEKDTSASSSTLSIIEGVEEIKDNLLRVQIKIGEELAKLEYNSQLQKAGKQKKMLRSFLIAFDAYINLEVKCVKKLQKRIEETEISLNQANLELGQYSTMNMVNNLKEVKERVYTLKTYIKEDYETIDAFKKQASNLYDQLVKYIRSPLHDTNNLNGAGIILDGTIISSINTSLSELKLGRKWTFPPSIKIHGNIIDPPTMAPSTSNSIQKQMEGESQSIEAPMEYTLNPMRQMRNSPKSNVHVNTSLPSPLTTTLSSQGHITQTAPQDPFASPSLLSFPPGIVASPLLQQQPGQGDGISSFSLPPTATSSNVANNIPPKKPFAWGNPNKLNENPISVKDFAQIQQEEIEAQKNATVGDGVDVDGSK